MAPPSYLADAEAGFGGQLNVFELMKAMIEAGAAGVHFEDQLASEKKCGHLGGKVLLPTAYIPAFCDIVVMVDQNASMYLGSPRMAEMVIGEKVSLEEMGGARMHCSISGCGDILALNEQEAIEMGRTYLSYFPANFAEKPKQVKAEEAVIFEKTIEDIIPANQNVPFNIAKEIGCTS